MVVCKFFREGNCRFGNACRFEHPVNLGISGNNQNRFGALQNSNDGRKDSGWTINANDIRGELTEGSGRPKWILSSYGPGKGTPASLLNDNEFSPEEVRVRFYEAAINGKELEADQEAIQLWTKAEQAIKEVVNNSDNVVKFMEEAEKKHPNRYDYCDMNGTKTKDEFSQQIESRNAPSSGFGSGSSFGQNTASSNPFSKPPTATFGQPAGASAFGSSPFGKPAFGQTGFGAPTSQGNTTFGQPAASGAFGKPAVGSGGFGQPAFGQAAQPSATFGQTPPQTSAFGQPAFGSSGFGQPAASNPFAAASASGGFGQSSSPFGRPAQTSSTFGQPSQPASTFGQPSQPTAAFGQPSQPTTTAFGKPSQPSTTSFGQPSQPALPFGQSSQPTSTFGQSPQPSSAFGQPSQPTTTFGQTTQPAAAFGQPSQPAISSAFGQPSGLSSAFGQPVTGQSSPFGQPIAATGGFGSGSTTGIFGKGNAAPSNVFGAPATSEPVNDQDMDASRPPTAGNPFAKPPDAATMASPQSRARSGSISTAPLKPNTNSSSTPHPLTDRPPAPLVYAETLPSQPNQTNMSKQLTSYRGQRVQYIDGVPCYDRPDRKGVEKIWFTDAGADPSVVALGREDKIDDLQGTEDEYVEEITEQYKFLLTEGKFKDGKIPLVPPMRDWCLYDF